jgi:type IV pilus assembly protein PilA
MRKQKGFSLIELLIVGVAIILIIAAIAIPNLLRARIAANEASAVSSLRTINTSEVTYSTTYPDIGYALDLATLGPANATCSAGPSSTNACMVDWNLGQAKTTAKSGYLLDAANDGKTPSLAYTAGAGAQTWNQTGMRSFCSVQDAVLRWLNPGATTAPETTTAGCLTYTIMQ